MNRYNIRNVAEREIYDSYMGILRISPNPVSESNNKLVDDPSSVLNSILTFDDLTDEANEIDIVLSDSDGNVLPVSFSTKARISEVINGETNLLDNLPIVNVITKLSKKLFISEKFKIYSTLYVDNTSDNKTGKKISAVQVVSNDGINDNLLLYPVECPNDEDYFNNKNKHIELDYDDVTSPHIQMKNKLYERSQKWYNDTFDDDEPEFVRVDGKCVTTFNKYGEIIPVLQSRDYVLGHYEGHTFDYDNSVKEQWMGYDSDAGDLTYVNGKVTRLSWLRIDNLVWDIIEKVIKGDFRHSNGRYKGLGYNQTDYINEVLFGDSPENCSICSEGDTDLNIMKTAPILGHGVQKGLIMYHAMPFHRYMFHVARQICRNLTYQFSKKEQNDTYQVKGEHKDDWDSFNKLALCVMSAKDKKLISPASDGTNTSLASLCKDFLLCDGKTISYKNYPNINIRNNDIFGHDVVMATPNNNYEIVENITTNGVISAMRSSMGNGELKTPSLYSLSETSPRFLRALNWEVLNHDNIIKLSSEGVSDTDRYYNSVTTASGSFPHILINEIEGEDYKNARTDYGNIIKDITKVGLYMHNYDIGIVRNDHYHKSFYDGDSTDYDKVSRKNTIGYESGRKRGGVNILADLKYCPNQDFRFLNDEDNSSNWYNYCFRKSSKNLIYGCPLIPNAGLNLFNGDLVNSENKTISNDYPWQLSGTTSEVEKQIKNKSYGYCDGQGVWHTLQALPDPKETLTNYLKNIHAAMGNKLGNLSDWLTSIENKTIGNNGISFIRAAFDAVKDCMSKGLSNAQVAEIFKNTFRDYYKKREIRKKQLVKMNESEGRIPAACSGGPYFKSSVVWSVTEKWKVSFKGADKQKRKAYSFYWAGVGNYKIGYNTKHEEMINNNVAQYQYRCLTSIPYEDSSKLGSGDVSKENSINYYDYNNVTSLNQDEDYFKISYGNVSLPTSLDVTIGVSTDNGDESLEENQYTKRTIVPFVQSNIPTPANLTLIPLIRI